MTAVKVSAHSPIVAVAGSIADIIRNGQPAEVRAIGADAVNQAVKAIAVVRQYLLPEGTDLACRPEFVQVDIDGKERTAIRFVVDVAGAPGTPD